jgi:ElaB/YqjD/DUF883 family membrane-anchored ribosome-binding protein
MTEQLPEGTDHIINGAMETGDGSDDAASAGSLGTGATSTAAAGGGSGSGFIGATGDDGTGGTASGTGTGDLVATGGTGGDAGGGASGGGSAGEQLRSQVNALRDQAGGRVREFAEGGKSRASDALEELSRVVAETADSIDERMGGQYGEYARRASDAVSGFADTLRTTDVDALYDNARSAVRKSPGIAIGVAAVVGFTLARLIKAGLPVEGERGDRTGNTEA